MLCQQVVLPRQREDSAVVFLCLSGAWRVLAGDEALKSCSARGLAEVIF